MNMIENLYNSICLEDLGFQDAEKYSASPLTKLEGIGLVRGCYI